MTDIHFQAVLKAAKLTARKHPDRPDTMIRRVQFSLQRHTFGHEEAEFLGDIGRTLLEKLKGRDMNRGEIPIDGYHGIAEFSGLAGNARIEVDGLVAKAAVVGQEEDEHEEITFDFEAPCEARLLTFLGASVKETIECDIRRSQLELGDAAGRLREALAPFDSVSVKVGEGEPVVLEGGVATDSPKA